VTTDLETRLRADLPRLADQLLAAPPADDVPLLPVRPTRPRGRWWVAAAGVVLLAVVAGVALAARSADERPATTSLTSTTTTLPPGTWRAIAQPALSPREDAPSIWTGKEWLLFGGRQGNAALADGAAYDPATDRWHALTPPISMHPGAIAVWTGRVVAVLAKQGGWIYDPEADTWTDLPLQDTTGQVVFTSAAVWTGHDVVVIGYGDDLQTLTARTLDPDTRTWGPVAASPRRGRFGTVAVEGLPAGSGLAGARWDGGRVQVWLYDGSGWAFDPAARAWAELSSLVVPDRNPETSTSIAGVGATTYAMVASGTDAGSTLQLAAFDQDRWRLVGPSIASRPADVVGQLVSAGDRLVWFSRATAPAVVDPATGSVRTLDGAPVGPGGGRSVTWTGSELFVFGGRDAAPVGTTGELSGKAAALTP
jgi:hypothetical protein